MTHTDIPTQLPVPGPNAQVLVEREQSVIAPVVGHVYPLAIDHARGCEVWDVDGNRYLDMVAGIAVLAAGHSHPRLVQAMQKQLTKYTHVAATDFYTEPSIRLAEKLTSLMPSAHRWQTFLTNSGTEAIEASLKLARFATRRQNIIAFYGAFHGRSYGSISLTASKPRQREGYFPLLPGVAHTHFPHCYRCPINLQHPACGIACLDMIEQTLFKTTMPPSDVAAIVVEPIQGEGGYVVPPAGSLQRLREICDRHGILLILDEIQSGVGRTGKMWAFEHEDIVPDIVATAKGLGGGMPLGAMVARTDLMQNWEPGAHGSTYSGHALSCVAAYETLCLVEAELQANAADVGAYLQERLRKIQRHTPQMGDVRGRGLMVGVEFIDPTTGEPDGALANAVMEAAFYRGLMLLTCGTSSIRFCPPLIITRAEVDEGLAKFEDAVQACV